MKTNMRHILTSGVIAASMVAAVSANASVGTTTNNVTSYTMANMLTDMHEPSANRSAVKFAQKSISASKAKSIARSRVKGGEVVDVSLRGNTYKVRIIAKNGRVMDVLIDAKTGRVK